MSNSFQSPNLTQPADGSRAIAVPLDFTSATELASDLVAEMLDGKIENIQSIYIDNADNSAVLDLILYGAPVPQRIRAPAYSQGWYPISWPVQSARFKAKSNSGATVNVIFANYAMPYIVWGPPSGITVVPALTNEALDALNFAGPGDQQLVPGIGGETVKFYRGIFTVDQPTVLSFTDGPAGNVLFAAQLTAGGSVTFQVSGVPWFNTTVGKDLTLHSTAACNVYGGFGYVQS